MNDIIKLELSTEKSQNLFEKHRVYTFICADGIRKKDVLKAFQKTHGFEVEDCHSMTVTKEVKSRNRKVGRKKRMKKFMIKLPDGKEIKSLIGS